jgi:N-acetylmuramoyl-L-alanine amidase
MSDVAIVVGHHPDAPGAALDLGPRSIHEYELWAPFARELALTLEAENIEASVVHRPHEDPDRALGQQVNETNAAAAIELHFNAYDGPAKGTEMLYWPTSTDGERLATLLQTHVTDALGTEDRRVVGTQEFSFLRLTEMPAVICEPAFGTNPQDAWRLLTHQPPLLRAYRQALTDYLDGTST